MNKMKLSRITNIVFLILLVALTEVSFAQNDDSVKVTKIFPGIIHKQIINKHDKLVINVLQVDLNNPDYKIEAVKAHNLLKARETASHLSKRISDSLSTVLAAINADFFMIHSGGEVINNMISNGQFVKAISNRTDDKRNKIFSQFALTVKNKPLIEKFNFRGNIFLKKGNKFKINRINSKTDSSTITLYNFYEGKTTPKAHAGWNNLEFGLKPAGQKGDTLIYVVSNKISHRGNNKIPSEGFILSSNNQIAKTIGNLVESGDTVKVLLQMIPNLGKIYTLTGGWPQIVKNGVNLAANSDSLEGTYRGFSVVKHPRTGIGFSKDSSTVYMFTVDGRQESSSGMSLAEFGNLMIREGVYQGLNLDGGGSTTMVIDNKIVNHPSDKTGERPVGNCLIIIKK